MKKHVLLLVAAALVAAPLTYQFAIAAEKEFKAFCPVSGGPAKEANAVDHHGRKVYFCCKNCPDSFKKEPAKYSAQVNAQLLATGQSTQVGCPYSGKATNPESTLEIAGSKVGFCCNGCKGKTEKASDEEKLAMVFGDDSFKKGFTLQTECPISGKAIKVSASAEHEGQKVYFCCEGCVEGFKKEPAKFTAKLPQFVK